MIIWLILGFLLLVLGIPLIFKMNKDKIEEEYPKKYFTRYLDYPLDTIETYEENLHKLPKYPALKFIFNLKNLFSDCLFVIMIVVCQGLLFLIIQGVVELGIIIGLFEKSICFNFPSDIFIIKTVPVFFFFFVFLRWIIALFHLDTIEEIIKEIKKELRQLNKKP
jgi:hypothetical protein